MKKGIMQRIIKKEQGRYQVSFAHWSKGSRTILSLVIVAVAFTLGWISWKDKPLPHWFETVIWNNLPVIYLLLIIVLISCKLIQKIITEKRK